MLPSDSVKTYYLFFKKNRTNYAETYRFQRQKELFPKLQLNVIFCVLNSQFTRIWKKGTIRTNSTNFTKLITRIFV